MKARWLFCVYYFLFWVGLFTLARVIFLAYHGPATARVGFGTLAGVLLHGLRMDVASAAYLTMVVLILVAASGLVPNRITRLLLGLFTIPFVVIVSLLVAVDLEIYAEWSARLDSGVLVYLNHAREVLATTGSSPVVLLLSILAVLAAVGVTVYVRILAPRIGGFPPARALAPASVLALLPLLAFGSRGGFQQIALNQSTVFFSSNEFANQAALNVSWNFFDSVLDQTYSQENPYSSLSAADAARTVDSLLAGQDETAPRLLTTTRPNILLIVWESLNAKMVRALGGTGAAPQFESWIPQGILFDHFYASGVRSDRGVVALLSGFPSLPRVTILKQPDKTRRLPFLPASLKEAGYHTAYFYGSGLFYLNKRSYLVNAGFHSILSKEDFPSSTWTTDWGAHDEALYGRALTDIGRLPQPFFAVITTLSTHEPFEVPGPPVIPGSSEEERFLNAQHYADRWLGTFLSAAVREPWWKNTLVVITSDHGHRLPVLDAAASHRSPEAGFHIPMLWLGGALAQRDTVISRLGGQTDLARTLLNQLHLAGTRFRWSRDLLAPDTHPFAFYAFNDGFGYLTNHGDLVYDNIGKRPLLQNGSMGEADRRAGMAYQQVYYQEYLDQ